MSLARNGQRIAVSGVVWLAAAVCMSLGAAEHDWAEGQTGDSTGATRDYYNRAALLKWRHTMGDWCDANNEPQGSVPFAVSTMTAERKAQTLEWDITKLVREWLDGRHPNQGVLLRAVKGGVSCRFRSREWEQADQQPQLEIVVGQQRTILSAAADTSMHTSTYRGFGGATELQVGGQSAHTLLRFDLPSALVDRLVDRATLRLYCHQQSGSGSTEIGVFRCAQGKIVSPTPAILGLAAKYPADRGIGADDQVIFSTDFESDAWAKEWTLAAELKMIDTINDDPERKFEPLSGKALRVKIAEGATGALNTIYKFQKQIGQEPEEIYFRYYLRLADDWNQTLQGGKMPGISGTYGVAGWGGRKSDGTDGWSARGAFHLTIPKDNPLSGLTPIGTYCYHADMTGTYGDIWIWDQGYRGFLQNNRWYAIEQHLRLNRPGEKDGVLRAWVDGRLAFDKSDIRFRHNDRLKIEQIWMNVYHGGTKPSPYDQHLYIDNVVIAQQYIGPMTAQ
ncbi:MAG: DNRLRE domain-containing protein [Pirellulaceae bacterium]|nr:DNRLRE domain-containing protein [Pirellulaceae bacterium]